MTTAMNGLETVTIVALTPSKPSKYEPDAQYRGVCIQRQSGEEWLNVSSTDPIWPHLARGEQFVLFLTEKGSRRLARIPVAEPVPTTAAAQPTTHAPMGFQAPEDQPAALDHTAEAIANMAALYGMAWEALKQELPELAAHPSALHAATATVLIGVQRRKP